MAEPDVAQAPSGAQTLLRLKRPRDMPSMPSLTVLNDAPTAARRVSMAQLQLQRNGVGVGPTVRQYRLLESGSGEAHHPPVTLASKAGFAARDVSRHVHDQCARSYRYRCVEERRMAASAARERFGGELAGALDERQVRLLELEIKPRPTSTAHFAPFVPFGPPVPSAAAARLGAELQAAADVAGADGFAYDVYMADEAGAPPAPGAVVYIEYPDDDAADDEFLADESDSDACTDDSNAEGHYANDYPDSEHSNSSEETNARRFDGLDYADDGGAGGSGTEGAGAARSGPAAARAWTWQAERRRGGDGGSDDEGLHAARARRARPLEPWSEADEEAAAAGGAATPDDGSGGGAGGSDAEAEQ